MMITPPNQAELRQALLTLVMQELQGPAGGAEEELPGERRDEAVRERYLIGMLAPRKQQEQIDPSTQDNLNTSGEEDTADGANDTAASQSPSYFPSSFGLSFCVAGEAQTLQVTANWGYYRKGVSSTQKHEKTSEPLKVWQRQPRGGTTIITLQEGDIPAWQPEPDEQPDIVVKGIVRWRGDIWIITLFLVNNQTESRPKDSTWIFQPEISVQAPNGQPIFRKHMTSEGKLSGSQSEEQRRLTMRYRNQVVFAVGHGVSVHAEVVPDDPTWATCIKSRVAPLIELPATTFTAPDDHATLAGLTLDMQTLAEAPAETLPTILTPLVATYAAWIAAQRERASSEPGLHAYQNEAQNTLTDCDLALTRIQAGITLISNDPQAAAAFAFMNRAMWLQRIHTIAAENRRNQREVDWATIDQPQNRSWRLFQLAFILINIPSLTDLHHADRSPDATALADLLWFPTGGGKTEAYLGLTAYTLAIRRLQGEVSGRNGMDGVAVLMRYTLRLLTLQQFQRAATLISACEVIRREAMATGDTRWGTIPFRIGLWVGQRTTPNWMEDSKDVIRKAHNQGGSGVGGSGTPYQLTHCPWCGAKINPQDVTVDSTTRRTLIFCGDPLGDCPFSAKQAPREGLPVVVVDEDIYRLLPALLIATVDKFAQLPWNGATKLLFGQVRQRCERHGYLVADLKQKTKCQTAHRASGGYPAAKVVACQPLRPPDLIIQDELHLINGPLGSLVGLYETAIDRLATWEVAGKPVRPKVVASTATVRQADTQIHALFLRQVAVFPPPGLDASDNFFAVQHPPTPAQPGRMYLGICAPGKRQKAVLIRVYVAFLAAAQKLFTQYGTHADPWMTLVGYFNTMRELGGTRRLVEDDIPSRLRFIDRHGLEKRSWLLSLEELTSRRGATDIPRILSQLETPFDPQIIAQRQAAKKEGTYAKLPVPLDVLLATNMISVGVDVSRLGLMVVTGQPKTTAEYIQATSRVGRSAPGLVCTIFHSSRPRDLSHYEQFEHYHATFYQQVEALSVTPFSARALDRGLSALLVAMMRSLGEDFNANDAASQLTQPHPYSDIVLATIPARAAAVMRDNAVADEVRKKLLERLLAWETEAQKPTGSGRVLSYRRKGEQSVGLLKPSEEPDWDMFTCLNSLRDVEPTARLMMDTGPLGTPIEAGYHVADNAPSTEQQDEDEQEDEE